MKVGDHDFVASAWEGECFPPGLPRSPCRDAKKTVGHIQGGALLYRCSQITIEQDGNIEERCIFYK